MLSLRFHLLASMLVLGGVTALSGCGGADTESATGSPESAGKLVLTGSSTVAPLMQEMGARYEAAIPGVRIDVQTGGSSRGVSDARSGLADIGMASRALKEDEGDLIPHTIALDGVCIILHAENTVPSLTDDQIRAIYRGEVTRWNEVGGADAPITVVNKAEGRSTLELFVSHFGLKSEEIKASVVIGDNEQGIKTVSTNPDAIGYVSIGAAEFSVSDGIPLKLLPMNGVMPSTENLRNKTYPLARPLNLVTKGEPGALAKKFIDFTLLPENHDLITGLYYVPVP